MFTSRLFSVFVAFSLFIVIGLTIRAGIVTSEVVSSGRAALDQHERHPASVVENYARGALDQQDRHPSLTAAEQARLAYRSGEWNAGSNLHAPLDAHERHPASVVENYARGALDQQDRHPSLTAAEQARLAYRSGEWNAGSNLYAPLDAHERHPLAIDVTEQARLEYRRGEWNAGSSASTAQFDVEQARIQWRAGK